MAVVNANGDAVNPWELSKTWSNDGAFYVQVGIQK